MNPEAWRHYLRAFRRPETALAAYHDALGADTSFARATLAYRLAALERNTEAETAFRRVF